MLEITNPREKSRRIIKGTLLAVLHESFQRDNTERNNVTSPRFLRLNEYTFEPG